MTARRSKHTGQRALPTEDWVRLLAKLDLICAVTGVEGGDVGGVEYKPESLLPGDMIICVYDPK